MAVEVGTILTTSSGWGKTRLEVKSLHKVLAAGDQRNATKRHHSDHHHHQHHHHHHHHHLAQRAGAGLAQGRVVKLVEGDQAMQMLAPDFDDFEYYSEYDFH